MALTQTLLQLKTRVRQKTDQENSDFITDLELTDYINSAISEFHDIIISRFEDYFVIDTDIVLSSGNKITLPIDFLKLRGLDEDLGGGDKRALKKYNFNERNITLSPSDKKYRVVKNEIHLLPRVGVNGTYTIWYIPTSTILSLDTDTLDGFNGWEEYVVIDASIRVMQKEESDVSLLIAQKTNLLRRIQTAGCFTAAIQSTT